jgi:4-nitrophenyl phosphatase
MDGVLYRESEPMPALTEFFAFLRKQTISFILATNNSTKTPLEYMSKLSQMGVSVSQEEILTSGEATALYLSHEYPPGTRIHVFGSPALKQAIFAAGFLLADEDVQVVVASMDREVNYEKLKRASLLIRQGARFIATNKDLTYPSMEGLTPGTGTFIVALEAASGVKAEVIGKPEPAMFKIALEKMNADPSSTAVIGDRVETDILGGKHANLLTICVLSGVSTRAEAEAYRADLIFEEIGDMLSYWRTV